VFVSDLGELAVRAPLPKYAPVPVCPQKLWSMLQPVKARVQLPLYLDFHLSCYTYISGKEVPPTAPADIDLVEAWEAAMEDWQSDTEDALELVHKRELHFHLFRDSLFELIDLYTPTTNPKQYIAYMRSLIASITHGGRVRYEWAKPQRRGEAAEIVKALREELGGEAGAEGWAALSETDKEARVARKFTSWLEEGCKGERAELPLTGFQLVCADLPPALRSPTTHAEATHLIDVFRHFDTDATGMITLSNMKDLLIRDEASEWFPRRKSSIFKSSVSRATAFGGSSKDKIAAAAAASADEKRTQKKVPSAKAIRNAGKMMMLSSASSKAAPAARAK
jgi:hypothetical protein